MSILAISRWVLVAIIAVAAIACNGQPLLPANKQATTQTANLYSNLLSLPAKGFLFGHQDDLAYGVQWRYEAGRSDVKEVAGDYPGIYGWELGGMENANTGKNIDGVPFDMMKQFIRDGYSRGAVVTLSWHMQSPFGYANGAWDTTHGSVSSILPGGANHDLYKTWLNRFAAFANDLRGPQQEAIPLLFRPFHEHSGHWFWWGRNACTTAEYTALWRFTFDYLHRVKGLNNLLWVYNTGGDFNTAEEFLERYPGDDVVDLLSFDTYQNGELSGGHNFARDTERRLALVGKLAAARNKPFALAETGYEQVPDANWWTKVLTPAIGSNKICYVLVWRNHGYNDSMKKMHYYAPYKGQLSAGDFKVFYQQRQSLFERDAKLEKLYGK